VEQERIVMALAPDRIAWTPIAKAIGYPVENLGSEGKIVFSSEDVTEHADKVGWATSNGFECEH
jgi:hypothetical protein